MKATERITKRILSTAGLLVLAVSIGYGQGLLVEGALKLFKTAKPVVESGSPDYIFASYNEAAEDSFNFKNFLKGALEADLNSEIRTERIANTYISKTINVSAVNVSYESELEAEIWMTTPLSNNVENAVTVESWMTESFTESTESTIAMENWMTQPFSEAIENKLKVEDWMTHSFSSSLESELEVEDWMSQPLSESIESQLLVEDWMTVSFTESTEADIEVENWMTESLLSR